MQIFIDFINLKKLKSFEEKIVGKNEEPEEKYQKLIKSLKGNIRKNLLEEENNNENAESLYYH